MSARTVTDMRAFEDALLSDSEIHLYPHSHKYRRSRQSPPQPGDIARCGHVKSNKGSMPVDECVATCAQCVRLSRMAGRCPV